MSSFLRDPRDCGARALRAYELQRDQRFESPFDSLSGDAREAWRKRFDRLCALMAVEGVKIASEE